MRRTLPILLLLLAACGTHPATAGDDSRTDAHAPSPLPAEPAYIRGTITAIGADGRIRVEEKPGEEWGGAKAVLTLTDATQVLGRDGGRADRAQLVPGRAVRAWVDGPVLESYPVQATAAVIVVE